MKARPVLRVRLPRPRPLDPGLLSYEPDSKTLFVPSAISEALRLEDGSVVPLPHDLLSRAVAEGNIQVVNRAEAVALEALAVARGRASGPEYKTSKFPPRRPVSNGFRV